MRIGIVTLAHNNDNFGGTLQAVALLRVLEDWGHNPFLCNVGPASIWSRRWRFNHPLRRVQEWRRYRAFMPFWRAHFRLDPQGRHPFADYVKAPTAAEVYLCGSDQVWAPYHLGVRSAPGERDFFLLNFGDPTARRVAYAASLGGEDFPAEGLPEIRAALARLDAVGVREESAVATVAAAGRSDAQWVCDPVMLAEPTLWQQVARAGEDEAARLGPVAFCPFYKWPTAFPRERAFRLLTETLGCRVRIPFAMDGGLRGFWRSCAVSPAGWLAALQQAPFVVTNSFHATLFAILFHRPFAVLEASGAHQAMNARFRALATRLGIAQRLVPAATDDAAFRELVQTPIDWAAIDARVAAWRSESRHFLCAALAGKRA